MSEFRFKCFSCGCFFDPEFNTKTEAMQPYLCCPRCGDWFIDSERCLNCGSPDLEVEDEDGLYICNSCQKITNLMDDDYCWVDTLEPVKCPNCKGLNKIWECYESFLNEDTVCSDCGKPWPDDPLIDDCPYCVEETNADYKCGAGYFVCQKCNNRWSALDYWNKRWSK
jgi:hypothetical protein